MTSFAQSCPPRVLGGNELRSPEIASEGGMPRTSVAAASERVHEAAEIVDVDGGEAVESGGGEARRNSGVALISQDAYWQPAANLLR